jgi:hypothetical protein
MNKVEIDILNENGHSMKTKDTIKRKDSIDNKNKNIFYNYFNIEYDLSCYSIKRIGLHQLKHCPMVSWTSASLYNNDTISNYNNPGNL